MKKPDQNLDEDFTANNILKLEIKELKAVYERSIATRDFEIQQLQNRNNYFIIFQGVMLSGVLMASASKPIIEFFICLFCFFFSIYQTNIAAGAKYWQEYWELKTSKSEKVLREKFDEYMKIYKEILIRKIQNEIEYLTILGMYKEKTEKLKKEIIKIRDGKYIFYHLFEFLEKEDSRYQDLQDFKDDLKARIVENEKKYDPMFKDSVNVFDLISNVLILKKYSVSRIPIIVGIFFTILWGSLFLSTIKFAGDNLVNVKGFTIEPNTHSLVDAGELPKSESDKAKTNIIKIKNVEE